MSADNTANSPPPASAPVTQSMRKPPKSPPLAFEKTSNDALAPLISPPFTHHGSDLLSSPSPTTMGPRNSSRGNANGFQDVVHKQAKAIQQLHVAFAAEREAWSCEREALHQRIESLEKLLTAHNGHSPAKSPTASPGSSSNVASPNSRATTATSSLPTIVEDEAVLPLSQRRDGAPVSIHLPTVPAIAGCERLRHNSVVAFTDDGLLKVEEIPAPAANITKSLSPPPEANRILAGHTPLKAPARPPTPPPKEKFDEGIEDTPTRNNTHINNFLTRYSSEEEDTELKGPLSMPELPNQPGEHNFTEEMLFKRLEKIAQTPDCDESRPMIFAEPSPGMITPEGEGYLGARKIETSTEAPTAPISTRNQTVLSASSSNANTSAIISPQAGAPLSQQTSQDHEAEARNFEHGGIKLKKKPSSNFGAPFGSLGGFGNVRRPS